MKDSTKHSVSDSLRVDRTALRIATHEEAEREDRAFWLSRTPIERMQHLELLRELNYGSERLNERFQRVLAVLERSRR